MLATDDTLFVVRSDAPYDTMEEFVAVSLYSVIRDLSEPADEDTSSDHWGTVGL